MYHSKYFIFKPQRCIKYCFLYGVGLTSWDGDILILAIDPGNIESAYVILDEKLKPIEFGKIHNEDLLTKIKVGIFNKCDYFAIEMIASYGMSVGQEIFDTCVWIGIFSANLSIQTGINPRRIYRKDEKINLCGTMKAKDRNIIQALKDRFGDKGTIKNKGWFFGFKADIWQAYAVGVTYYDLYVKDKLVEQKPITTPLASPKWYGNQEEWV